MARALARLLDLGQTPGAVAPCERPVLPALLLGVRVPGDERAGVGVEDRLDQADLQERRDVGLAARGPLLEGDEVEVLDQRVLELMHAVLVDEAVDAELLAREQLRRLERRSDLRIALDPLPLDGEERVAHAPPQSFRGPLRVELAQCAQARDHVLAAQLGAGGATPEQAGEDPH